MNLLGLHPTEGDSSNSQPVTHLNSIRTLVFAPVGSCILNLAPTAVPTHAQLPIRVEKLGFLLVSLHAQLTNQSSTFHQLRLFQYDLLSVRSKSAIIAFLIPGAHLLTKPSPSSTTATAIIQTLRLQLHHFMHALESYYAIQLTQLNLTHQQYLDAMIQQDGIKQQMAHEQQEQSARELGESNSTNPLANTHTIPLLHTFQQFIQRRLERNDVDSVNWFKSLMPPTQPSKLDIVSSSSNTQLPTLPTSPIILGAYLISSSSPATDSSRILLSQLLEPYSSLNLVGPTNTKLWSLICAYSEGMSQHQRIALSFPLLTAPLLIYLHSIDLPPPHSRACLIVYQLGPSRPANQIPRGVLPGAEWLSPIEAVIQAEKKPLTSFLPSTHPLIIEALKFPKTYSVIEHEALLPQWHSDCKLDLDLLQPSLSVWSQLPGLGRMIEDDFLITDAAPPILSDLASSLAAAAPSPISDATSSTLSSSFPSVSPPLPSPSQPLPSESAPISSPFSDSDLSPSEGVISASIKPIEEEKQDDSTRLLGQNQIQSSHDSQSQSAKFISFDVDEKTQLELAPVKFPHPHPPPSTGSNDRRSSLELGTASFHRRKMMVVQPSSTMTTLPGSIHPHPHPPHQPLAPLIGVKDLTGSSGRTLIEIGTPTFRSQPDPPLELSMDTPRLALEHEPIQTARLVYPSSRGSGGGTMFPSLDRSDSANHLQTTLQNQLLQANDHARTDNTAF